MGISAKTATHWLSPQQRNASRANACPGDGAANQSNEALYGSQTIAQVGRFARVPKAPARGDGVVHCHSDQWRSNGQPLARRGSAA